MKQYRDSARDEGWGPPFPDDEYRRRHAATVDQMRARGIDTLVITSPPNITYLTGYDMVWYYLRTPTAVVLNAHSGDSVFFDLEYHRPTIQYHAVVDEADCFESFHGAAEHMVESLASRGWAQGSVGLECWSRNPNTEVLDTLRAGLRSYGATPTDASWLVDTLRLIKSPLEAEVMRGAASIADYAMSAVADEINAGMTEIEIAGRVLNHMMSRGGGDPAIRVAIRSGPRFLARHCAPSPRRVQTGELIWLNFSGSLHRYHADLGRLVSLGEPDERWVDLIDRASNIAKQVLSDVSPDESVQTLQTNTEQASAAAGIQSQAELLGGYDMGIAIPPDWVGHTFTNARRGFVEAHYSQGMCTNFEMLFRTAPDWRGGAGGGFIETVMMTPSGLEVLSELPRSITVR